MTNVIIGIDRLYAKGEKDSNNLPMETEQIRIVILDSHALVRAGLRSLLDVQPNMKVVGEAGNQTDGLAIISSQQPDIVLFELNLTEHLSPDIITQILLACDTTHPIIVTGINNPVIIQQLVENGAMGVVFKSQSPDTLIKAIEKVNNGEVWLERSMIANVLSRLSRTNIPVKNNTEVENIDELSDREKEIVRLIGKGYKNKRISSQLCISETTVRHHLTSIYNKLGVTDRLELLVYAHRFGLVKPPNS
jgi:two-component system nitrate/nitrite response regulator NarL